MEIVLGVSMAPDSVQLVLLEGESADGATIDENAFPIAHDAPTVSASDRALAAIVGTRDDANGAGIALTSVGVACTDHGEATALRDALSAHKVENVMLVSAFMAAAALAQSVGAAMGYESTAMLLVEPDLATLAVVETADGSVADVHTAPLHDAGTLTGMVADLDERAHPGGLMVIGRGVDVAPIKWSLQKATTLAVSAPEEPETALARGAALASAHALTSPTSALAYAQDPGTGALDESALPEYLGVAGGGDGGLAYSALADDEASTPTVVLAGTSENTESRRKSKLLVGSAIAVASFAAALALEVALTVGVHTTVGLLPAPLHNIVAPAERILAPVPAPAAANPAAPIAVPPPPEAPVAAAPPPPAAAPVAPPQAAPALAAPPAAAVPAPAPPLAPLIVAPVAPIALPPIHLPVPPVTPPAIQASPPGHVPPPDQAPPGHPGGPSTGNPGGGGPATGQAHGAPSGGPGPGHPLPGAGGEPHGGGGGGPTSGGTGGSGGGPASHAGAQPHAPAGGTTSAGGANTGGHH